MVDLDTPSTFHPRHSALLQLDNAGTFYPRQEENSSALEQEPAIIQINQNQFIVGCRKSAGTK